MNQFPQSRFSGILLFAAIITFGTSLIRAHDSTIYHFSFSDGSLTGEGTAGGTLEEIRAPGSSSALFIDKDATLGRYFAQLPMTENGERGDAFAILDSDKSFRLDKEHDSITISCWIKWSGPDKHDDPRQGIITIMPVEKTSGWGFSVLASGQLTFNWIDRSGHGSMRTSSQSLTKNEWTHVAMTWDNNNPQKGLRFYLNGEPAGIDLEYTGGGPLKTSDSPLFIGVLDNKNYLPLNGCIADIRIYDQVLDSNAIFDIFQDTRK